MTTTAFGARRVTESLNAIARYLDQATKTAAGVSRPSLTSVRRHQRERPIAKPLQGSQALTVTAKGSNLSHVHEFKLKSGTTEHIAKEIRDITDKSFVAAFDDVRPQTEPYDAWVSDEVNQSFVLPHALLVVEAYDDAEIDESTGVHAAEANLPSSSRGQSSRRKE